MMDWDQRCPAPESFVALYRKPGAARAHAEPAWLMERHDLCEQLAQQLLPAVRASMADDGLSASDMVPRCRSVLASPEIGLAQAEVQWVIQRVLELAGQMG